jgi:hypothetical protein
MHGLVNRAIQCFVRDTYGPDRWAQVAHRAGIGVEGFEAMLVYDDSVTAAMLDATSALLGRTVESILEDVGTYLVSNPNVEALRRLMRFGGSSFADFLLSVEDLPERSHLAVPDLAVPVLELREPAPHQFVLTCRFGFPGAGHVVLGLLRALADDYGTLALFEIEPGGDGVDTIMITLHKADFAAGRRFQLTAQGGAP